MKKYSLWLDDINEVITDSLRENLEVDILIIGGGMTGIMTAYNLIDTNFKICLVEKNIVGHGITSRTTGKLTFLQDDIYCFLNKNYYFEIAKKYLKSQKEAISIVKNIVEKNNINCDFEKIDSYILSKDKKKLDKEKSLLEKMGVKVANSFLFNYDAIKVQDTAIFHPLKYLNSIKEILIKNNIKLYENSTVTNIKKEKDYYICDINNHKVKAKKVVIACHYPFFLIPFLLPLKTSIEKSYLSASKANKKNISAITIENPIKSFRSYNDYLIYLSNSHNTSFNSNYESHFKNLEIECNKMNLNPEYIWSNHDIMTYDRLPFIGEIKENLWIGTGYNTWGMTNSNLAGKIISDSIKENYNEYYDIFDPNRKSLLLKAINYPCNIFYSGKSLIQNKIKKDKSWYSNLKFEKRNGKSIAIYKDEKNKEHIVYTTCPHLGCTLLFNETEKTWDCPCHGSRFDIDGKSLCGPSKNDICESNENKSMK